MAKKDKTEFVIFLILLAILLFFLFVYLSSKNKKNLSKNDFTSIESDKREKMIPTNTPTPKPIPHGKVEFTVSTGKGSIGPEMSQGSVDPYDPSLGATQTLTIQVAEPVEKVVAILKTDNKVSPEYQLKKIDEAGNWIGSWTVNDSYLYKYTLTIKATGPTGTSKIDYTLR